MLITEYYPQFFTATILEWKHLLENDKYKDIIVDSLRFLVEEKRILVYAFVIMPNHLHTIWQIQAGHLRKNVQRDFLKFTAQNIKYDLRDNNRDLLREFEVNARDRQHQFWERNPLSVDIYSRKVFLGYKRNGNYVDILRTISTLRHDFIKPELMIGDSLLTLPIEKLVVFKT